MLLSAWVVLALQAGSTFEGSGSALTHGTALELATRAALEKAVAKATSSAVAESPLAADVVLAEPARFVKKTEELSSEEQNHQVKVTVRAEIDAAALEKQLREVQRQMRLLGQRKVLVAIDEQSIEPDGEPAAVATKGLSTAITGMLKRDGWVILDGTGRYASYPPTREELDRVALELQADEILTGTVKMHRMKATGDGAFMPTRNHRGEQMMFFVSGEYALKLVDTGTWMKRATLDGKLDQSAMNRIQAGKSYAQTELAFAEISAPQLTRTLRERMLFMLDDMEKNGLEVRVLLTNVEFDTAARVEERLKTVKNVKSVELRGDYEDRRQALEVRFSGTAQALAKELGALKGLKLVVRSVRTAFIELSPAR